MIAKIYISRRVPQPVRNDLDRFILHYAEHFKATGTTYHQAALRFIEETGIGISSYAVSAAVVRLRRHDRLTLMDWCGEARSEAYRAFRASQWERRIINVRAWRNEGIFNQPRTAQYVSDRLKSSNLQTHVDSIPDLIASAGGITLKPEPALPCPSRFKPSESLEWLRTRLEGKNVAERKAGGLAGKRVGSQGGLMQSIAKLKR